MLRLRRIRGMILALLAKPITWLAFGGFLLTTFGLVGVGHFVVWVLSHGVAYLGKKS